MRTSIFEQFDILTLLVSLILAIINHNQLCCKLVIGKDDLYKHLIISDVAQANSDKWTPQELASVGELLLDISIQLTKK